jgi:hypothetical protein
MAPTVIGEDPYNSYAPKLRAKVIIPKSLDETPGEDTDANSDDSANDSGDEKEPRTTPNGIPIARPIAARPLVARPIAPVVPEEEKEDPAADSRVKLPAPKPISFD